jgi:5-methylcytosine-specific restriction endonuclease McrA
MLENVMPQERSTKRPDYDRWYRRAHWTALRTIVLAREPICRICQRAASTVADHIVPHKGNWALFCDLDNLEGICGPCHSKKTATEDGGFGNRPASNPSETNTPTVTGDSGKQFQSSSIKVSALDKALDFDVDSLLKGIPE